jgi:biotin transporter BioY
MLTVKTKRGNRVNFFHFHSLSLVALGILLLWIVLYIRSDPSTHAGSFFGNAIADWSGSVVIIIATKYFFERGSEESRPVRKHPKGRILNFLYCHSLSIFLVGTGIVWFVLYARMDANSKWGQVVGNISSEWVQTLGLVLMTKKLIERGSRESRQR